MRCGSRRTLFIRQLWICELQRDFEPTRSVNVRRSLRGYCPRSKGASTVPRLDRQPSVLAVGRALRSLLLSATVAAPRSPCCLLLCLCSFVSTVLVSVCPGVGVNIFECRPGVSMRILNAATHNNQHGPCIDAPRPRSHVVWRDNLCGLVSLWSRLPVVSSSCMYMYGLSSPCSLHFPCRHRSPTRPASPLSPIVDRGAPLPTCTTRPRFHRL